MDSMTILAIAIIVAIIAGIIVIFNSLIAKRQMAHNGWSDIDVQLKRRADLIPQLVATVRGYAAHERQLFADIAEKRFCGRADSPRSHGSFLCSSSLAMCLSTPLASSPMNCEPTSEALKSHAETFARALVGVD